MRRGKHLFTINSHDWQLVQGGEGGKLKETGQSGRGAEEQVAIGAAAA